MFDRFLLYKSSALVFFLALFFTQESSAAPNNLRNYQFTSDFVECVGRFSSEESLYSSPGRSVSSLMNGEGVFSGPMGSNYWSYMNCLQPSGTANSLVDASSVCPGLSLPVNGKTIYVPPGKDGKTIGLSGRYWECQGSNWVRLTSLPSGSAGGGGYIPDPDPQNCNSSIVSSGQCLFSIPETRHGRNFESQFGRFFGDQSDFNGTISGRCENGSFRIDESSCERHKCRYQETVQWSGSSTSLDSPDFSRVRCEGAVTNSYAEQKASPVRYYPTSEIARDRTSVLSGYADFACHNDRWVPLPGAVCERKPREELSCQGVRADNNSMKFYCE